jgi:hypothetical protein
VRRFVAAVLADPTSTSRQLLDGALDLLGWLGVLVAGAILAVATYVVRTQRQRDRGPASRPARTAPPTRSRR